MQQSDLDVRFITTPTIPSSFTHLGDDHNRPVRYRSDHDRVLLRASFNQDRAREELSFERAGPRQLVAFRSEEVVAGILTCGGLCPGLNDVIHSLVMALWFNYGVRRILGLRYGFQALGPDRLPPIPLEPENASGINNTGGTFLGSARGNPPVPVMVDRLTALGINQLFVIGGDGTQRCSHDIAEEAQRRGLKLAVIGIPKTIDNDIAWVDQTFGFDTAVGEASRVIDCAHVEAKSAPRGFGLVRLMGRDAGFVAVHAALASLEANVVLIPELPFDIDGPHGLLAWLQKRIDRKNHAVLVVAEGAGQEHFQAANKQTDAGGNKQYNDIGLLLRDRIVSHFKTLGNPVNMKYLDPSYQVRSVSANATDRILCMRLAHNAVHAAMAGKTDMLVGKWYGKFTYAPLSLITSGKRNLDPTGSVWRALVENTGQPSFSVLKTEEQRAKVLSTETLEFVKNVKKG
jgi:6-phosphofructokinase 1